MTDARATTADRERLTHPAPGGRWGVAADDARHGLALGRPVWSRESERERQALADTRPRRRA